ncbi:beta-lactamase family protein [Subsaximicrobium wynnwilliamsii]|uniref:Beta-lactamase family protein n=1 Tax=Subsaximicrobium wynnwilliamsii TaxID=291179 RepID=A0A5C6ZHE5_9FLAO|nr:serine hydrolase domain-containing protein [Subsaximicrobium wynnwilliamsii]TXD82887.1 beta-lactamase family protein [Subsaximicrobium wynnwilliamsii]TXD88609.1 beta-lactamase family protein [Subsaximicrobium wynnwilliamsii]TXE02701.1 beta-lactamase family protein [Subsaximicrobium wynnwilliamsii]
MKFKKLLLSLIFISNIGIASYSQTSNIQKFDTIQQRINKVENSLSPLALNPGASLWNLEKQMQKYNVSGLSIAVIHNYEIEWAKGYGSTGAKEIPNVTEQTVFQAASISKFVNAVAMLKLMELKKIDLNEDINNYLTSWKFPYNKNVDTNPITIRQLLSHTAGLSTHGFGGYKNSDKLPSIIQTLEGKNPANSDKVEQILPTNKKFKYSGGGTTISQLILMDNSISSYESFLNKNLFEPLQMNNSFYSTEFDKYPKDLAFGHKGNGKTLNNNYNLYPESAAAGLWTTPTNLSKLITDIQRSLKNGTGKILSQQATKELIEPTLKNSNSALGVFSENQNGQLYLQHSGANKGFRGKFYFSAENGNGVVIMLTGTNTEIIEEIIRSVVLVYNWAGFEKLLVSPELNLRDIDLRKYIGTYVLENRNVQVSLKKGDLILTEKGKWSSKLTALNNSTFVVDIVKPQATIEFVTDTDGSISKCILKQGELTEWIKKE